MKIDDKTVHLSLPVGLSDQKAQFKKHAIPAAPLLPSLDHFKSMEPVGSILQFGSAPDTVTCGGVPAAAATNLNASSVQSLRNQGLLVITPPGELANEVVDTLGQEDMNPLTLPLADIAKTPLPTCGLVLEDATTTLQEKRAVLKQLDDRLPPEKMIATNPQGFRLQDLTEGLAHPQRVVGVRFFAPVQKNKLVELMAGPDTSPEVLRQARKIIQATGKVAVVCRKDSPGALVDRLLVTTQMEALRLVQEGWGTPDEIDQAIVKLLGKKAENGKAGRTGGLPLLKNLKGQSPDWFDRVESLATLGLFYDVPTLLQSDLVRLKEARRVTPANGIDNPKTRFFPQGVQTVATDKSTLPQAARLIHIRQRLTGSLLANGLQMCKEGLCEPVDLETVARVGLSWQSGPFAALLAMAAPQLTQTLAVFQNSLKPGTPLPPLPTRPIDLTGIKAETRNGVCTITMDRPFELNTLRVEIVSAIVDHLKAAEADPSVRAIVLASNSGKVFSGGADLGMFKDAPSLEAFRDAIDRGKELINRIAGSSKLTIAKIQGPTYGASTELALGFDRRVVSQEFSMKLPEVNIGLAPVWGGTERMIKILGRPLAKALILNGKFEHGLVKHLPKPLQKLVNGPLNLDIDRDPGFVLDAHTAKAMGMVDAVVPRQYLDDALEELLKQPGILEKPDPERGLKRYKTVEDYPQAIQQAYRLKDIETETGKHLGRFSKRARPLAIRLMDQVGTPQEGYLSDADYVQMAADTKAKIRKVYVLKDMAMALQGKQIFAFLKHFYSVLSQ